MDKLAELALQATRSKKLQLIPAHQEKVWEHSIARGADRNITMPS